MDSNVCVNSVKRQKNFSMNCVKFNKERNLILNQCINKIQSIYYDYFQVEKTLPLMFVEIYGALPEQLFDFLVDVTDFVIHYNCCLQQLPVKEIILFSHWLMI